MIFKKKSFGCTSLGRPSGGVKKIHKFFVSAFAQLCLRKSQKIKNIEGPSPRYNGSLAILNPPWEIGLIYKLNIFSLPFFQGKLNLPKLIFIICHSQTAKRNGSFSTLFISFKIWFTFKFVDVFILGSIFIIWCVSISGAHVIFRSFLLLRVVFVFELLAFFFLFFFLQFS